MPSQANLHPEIHPLVCPLKGDHAAPGHGQCFQGLFFLDLLGGALSINVNWKQSEKKYSWVTFNQRGGSSAELSEDRAAMCEGI